MEQDKHDKGRASNMEHWNILECVHFSAEMPSVSFSSGLACLSMSNIQAFPSSCNAAAWRGVHCGPFSFRKAGEAIESNKVFRMFTSGSQRTCETFPASKVSSCSSQTFSNSCTKAFMSLCRFGLWLILGPCFATHSGYAEVCKNTAKSEIQQLDANQG